MTTLHLASALAVFVAVGHSYLSERLFLMPLRGEAAGASVMSGAEAKRLTVAMYHMPSLCWAAMAANMLMLDPANNGHRGTLFIYTAFYAVSGLGNFWAVGKPHFGGVMLLSAGALILVSIYA